MSRLTQALERCPVWQDAFKASTIRAGFGLVLSRAMAEFISAVADGVHWDRSKYGSAQPYPDNFLATAAALIKRGLINEKPRQQADDERNEAHRRDELWTYTQWQLTPAGVCVVELLKLAGLFVEADAAIEKKHRKGK